MVSSSRKSVLNHNCWDLSVLNLSVFFMILCPLLGVIGCKDLTTSDESIAEYVTPPPASPLIALTPAEYNNTISDLFGFPRDGAQWPQPHPVAEELSSSFGQRSGLFGTKPLPVPPWPWVFPKEIGVDEFEGMSHGQISSAYQVEQLQKAADHFAAFSLVSPIFFFCESWTSLQDTNKTEALTCAWNSLERFAQRAWRRPMTDAERSRLDILWTETRAEVQLSHAIALIVSAILQSPSFIFKIERGHSSKENSGRGYRLLNDWEMASRLSYFLWDTMPDAILFEAAAQGHLSTIEDVEVQTQRMLDDPLARHAVVSFHHQILGTHDVQKISPARRAHASLFGLEPNISLERDCDLEWPAIIGPIRASLEAEATLFIERTIFDGDGSLTALLTDNHGYLSDESAFLYGDEVTQLSGDSVTHHFSSVIASNGNEDTLTLYPVEFPSTQRAGLLTLPSVLAVGSYPVHPAPILRGKRILERLTCQTLGTPPPDAEALIPPDLNEAEGTNRTRTEAITSSVACAGCHELLNPLGFAFENYDVFGRWRDKDNGIQVDASGQFTLMSGEQYVFENGVELAHQLSESTQVRDCYVRHWVQYAVGYTLDEGQETLTQLQMDFRQSDDVKDLLVKVTSSDLFRYLSTTGDER